MRLIPLYLHLILLTLGNAFLLTLVAVYLSAQGAPAMQIGLVGSAFYLGMLGASFLPIILFNASVMCAHW